MSRNFNKFYNLGPISFNVPNYSIINNMDELSFRLSKLINDNKLSKRKLSEILNVTPSMISAWTSGRKVPNLENSIKLADYFSCSLDFLFGLKDIDDKTNFKQVSNFNEQLKKILKEKKISQNKLVNDTKFNFVNTNGWLNKNVSPNLSTIIDLADYLNVSLDYLAGRE